MIPAAAGRLEPSSATTGIMPTDELLRLKPDPLSEISIYNIGDDDTTAPSAVPGDSSHRFMAGGVTSVSRPASSAGSVTERRSNPPEAMTCESEIALRVIRLVPVADTAGRVRSELHKPSVTLTTDVYMRSSSTVSSFDRSLLSCLRVLRM